MIMLTITTRVSSQRSWDRLEMKPTLRELKNQDKTNETRRKRRGKERKKREKGQLKKSTEKGRKR
jgi:hypothetical protein